MTVSVDGQTDRIYNHLSDESLGMPCRIISIELIEVKSPAHHV